MPLPACPRVQNHRGELIFARLHVIFITSTLVLAWFGDSFKSTGWNFVIKALGQAVSGDGSCACARDFDYFRVTSANIYSARYFFSGGWLIVDNICRISPVF